MQTIDTETLRRRLQEERDRAERLEKALVDAQRLCTVGQLASRMAHEFNNLLMLMMGRAEQALRHDDPELRRQALEKTLGCGSRAADIVSGILGYARGRGTAKSELVAPHELAEGALGLLAWDLAKDRVRLVRQYQPSPPVRVVRGRLEQVLLNLVLNARKAMGRRGGTLTVAVGPADEADYVALAVSDTGCGIEPDRLPHIFDPFVTSAADDASATGGTGLGLPVARDLVRQAGGEIRVESAPGAGSTFTVLLPMADADD